MRSDSRSAISNRTLVATVIGACALAMTAGPVIADSAHVLALQETSKRDYYCVATFALEAADGAAFEDVNGYFHFFIDDREFSRSRGASFRFVDGERTALASFATPDVPCAEVNGFVFVVSSCLKENQFADPAECAAAIAPVAPVREIRAR